MCERVIIINKGEIVASGTPDSLSKHLNNSSRLSLRVAGPEKSVIKVLNDIPGVKLAEYHGTKEQDTVDVLVEGDKDVDIRKPLFFALSRAQYPILLMKSMDLTLEEIFLQLTTKESEVS